MIDAPLPDARRASDALDRVLAELDARTDLPLRLVSRDATDALETLELREEGEVGEPGRRFLASVDRASGDLLVVVFAGEGRPS